MRIQKKNLLNVFTILGLPMCLGFWACPLQTDHLILAQGPMTTAFRRWLVNWSGSMSLSWHSLPWWEALSLLRVRSDYWQADFGLRIIIISYYRYRRYQDLSIEKIRSDLSLLVLAQQGHFLPVIVYFNFWSIHL